MLEPNVKSQLQNDMAIIMEGCFTWFSTTCIAYIHIVLFSCFKVAPQFHDVFCYHFFKTIFKHPNEKCQVKAAPPVGFPRKIRFRIFQGKMIGSEMKLLIDVSEVAFAPPRNHARVLLAPHLCHASIARKNLLLPWWMEVVSLRDVSNLEAARRIGQGKGKCGSHE